MRAPSHRPPLVARTTLALLLVILLGSPAAAKCVGSKIYYLTFQFNWTPATDAAYPAAATPGFSDIVCATHDASYSVWASSALASSPVVAVAERGDSAPLRAALRRARKVGGVLDVATAPGPVVSPAPLAPGEDPVVAAPPAPSIAPTDLVKMSLAVNGTSGHTLVSCIAGIHPSPDFFVGLASLDLCRPNGEFNETQTLLLRAWDAGTDSGVDYTSQNEPVPASPGPGAIRALLGYSDNYGTVLLTDRASGGASGSSAADPSADSTSNQKETSTAACFPAAEQLHVGPGPGDTVSMRDARAGHFSADSEIFFFSHQDPDVMSEFVQLDTASTSIRLSPDHYIYAILAPLTCQHSQSSPPHQPLSLLSTLNSLLARAQPPSLPPPSYLSLRPVLVPASTIRPGDSLLSPTSTPLPVLSTSRTHARGLYNPHTLSGDAVVSGVRVSCYTRAVPPPLAHALLAPLRFLHVAGALGPARWAGRKLASGLPPVLISVLAMCGAESYA
jgi:Spondin_N/Hint module